MNQTTNNKPDYGNWVPKAMMQAMAGVLAILVLAALGLAMLVPSPVPAILCGVLAAVLLLLWLYMYRCRVLFDFNRGGLMGQIHQYLVDHLDWDGQGKLLDIGCGSGALINRCARRFPQARMTGIDFWGPEWSYAKEQCQRNARLEGTADRIVFEQGDAAHLAFPDQSFDAVVSNFVFHEVHSQKDKQKLLLEALRVLKKGGSFALQDLFAQGKLYGDMDAFVRQLLREGFQEVHYIPFVERQGFIPAFVQAPWMLHGIGLLYGKK